MDEFERAAGCCDEQRIDTVGSYFVFPPVRVYLAGRPYMLLSDSAREEFSYLDMGTAANTSPDNFDSVIIGLAPEEFNYEKLNIAFRTLISRQRDTTDTENNQMPLLTCHRARYVRTSDGELSLGPGPFVAALEEASGVRAEAIGKPNTAFFNRVLDSLQDDLHAKGNVSSWENVVIIGDDVTNDLGEGAIELGLRRVLGK